MAIKEAVPRPFELLLSLNAHSPQLGERWRIEIARYGGEKSDRLQVQVHGPYERSSTNDYPNSYCVDRREVGNDFEIDGSLGMPSKSDLSNQPSERKHVNRSHRRALVFQAINCGR